MIDFRERITYDGDLEQVLFRIISDYKLGQFDSYSIVEFGFEDLNIKLKTTTANFLVKIYSKNRTTSEIVRNADILRQVKDSGVRHPEIYLDTSGKLLHTDEISGLQMVVMEFVEGQTFYQMGSVPTD